MKATNKALAIILGMLLAMGITISVGATDAADGNLLQNPSFEDGFTGWTAKRGNSVATQLTDLTTAADYTTEFTAPTADGGAKYAAFPVSSAQSILTQRVEGLQAGSAYVFEGWGYATKADKENTYVTYSFYKGEEVIQAPQDILMTLAVTTWTPLQATFIMPEGADAVEIGIKTTGGDTFTRSYDLFSLKATENILSNPSFESGLSSWTSYRKNSGGPLSGTTLYETGEGVAAPAEDCGTSYVAFPTNSGESYLTQRVSGLAGGATYMFSGWGYTITQILMLLHRIQAIRALPASIIGTGKRRQYKRTRWMPPSCCENGANCRQRFCFRKMRMQLRLALQQQAGISTCGNMTISHWLRWIIYC